MLIMLLSKYELDIYNLSTQSINKYLRELKSVTYSKILKDFFTYATIQFIDRGIRFKYRPKDLRIYSGNNKRFNINEILPETYLFREYSTIFSYCNDYYLHIENSISEMVNKNTCTYASTWFYVMSHLNNAWRSSDFAHFPLIDVKDLLKRIVKNDLSWFLNNQLNKAEATIVTLRIQENPKIISKTKKYTRFVCSEELLQTYATLYLLLALFAHLNFTEDCDYVTHFCNKYEGVSKVQLDTFFKGIDIPKFRFKSRKMNKTLLSMIDYLENFYLDNSMDVERRQAALLRSHVRSTSTVPYIKKSKEVFDRLSNMICARGEFGYAYEMLIRKSTNPDNDLSDEEMTDKIRTVRQMIPNMKDLDNLYGFINFTYQEQEQLTKYIKSLSLEEFNTKITSLYLNHLGSKAHENISCIKDVCTNSSEDENECLGCIFHIPSLYSLTIVCQEIKQQIIMYQEATIPLVRKKLFSKIVKRSRDLIWASKYYDEEILMEILSLAGMDYYNFMNLLTSFSANNSTNNVLEEK